MKGTLVVMLCVAFSATAYAQSEEARIAILEGKAMLAEAVSVDDRATMRSVRGLFDRVASDPSALALASYYSGYSSYVLAMTYPIEDRGVDIDRAIEALKTSIDTDEDFADAYALLGRCYSIKIGIDNSLGPVLGSRDDQLLAKAKSLDPNNPRIALFEGWGFYWTPEEWGGSKEKALSAFQKAARLFEESSGATSDLLPDWGHAEAYAWTGRILIEQNRMEEGKMAYRKALTLDRDLRWVRDILGDEKIDG